MRIIELPKKYQMHIGDEVLEELYSYNPPTPIVERELLEGFTLFEVMTENSASIEALRSMFYKTITRMDSGGPGSSYYKYSADVRDVTQGIKYIFQGLFVKSIEQECGIAKFTLSVDSVEKVKPRSMEHPFRLVKYRIPGISNETI